MFDAAAGIRELSNIPPLFDQPAKVYFASGVGRTRPTELSSFDGLPAGRRVQLLSLPSLAVRPVFHFAD